MALLVSGSDAWVPADSRCWTGTSLKVGLGDGAVSQSRSARFPTVMERNKDISIHAELSSWHHHSCGSAVLTVHPSCLLSTRPSENCVPFVPLWPTDVFTKAELLSSGAPSVFPDSLSVPSHWASTISQTNQAANENTCENTGLVTIFCLSELICYSHEVPAFLYTSS